MPIAPGQATNSYITMILAGASQHHSTQHGTPTAMPMQSKAASAAVPALLMKVAARWT